MLTLLAALALTTSTPDPMDDPAAQQAAVTYINQQLSDDSVQKRINVCRAIEANTFSDNDVEALRRDFDLENPRELADFAISCSMYIKGLDEGSSKSNDPSN